MIQTTTSYNLQAKYGTLFLRCQAFYLRFLKKCYFATLNSFQGHNSLKTLDSEPSMKIFVGSPLLQSSLYLEERVKTPLYKGRVMKY